MTIAVCYIVNNDLPMLRVVLPYERRWADSAVVIDLGSNDGTKEFCEKFLDEDDVYFRRESNTVPERGFSEARNLAFSLSNCDWLYHSGANCLMDGVTWQKVYAELECATADVVEIKTKHIDFTGYKPHELEKATALHAKGSPDEYHRCIVRRASNCRYKGFLHEELYAGEESTYGKVHRANLTRWHFEGSGNHELRVLRYSFMLSKAAADPELQKYTSPWWYTVHYPCHKDRLEAQAARYKELVASTGIQ